MASFDGLCSTEILVLKPKERADKGFIFHIIQSDNFIENATSKTFGTKMPRTDWGIVASFGIAIPSKIERLKIGEILSDIDEKILINKKNKEKLTQLKKGLIDDLLSGKKRI